MRGVTRVVDLPLVVRAISEHTAEKSVGERVTGIVAVRQIAAEVNASIRVVEVIDADVAGIVLQIVTPLHGVLALNPGGIVRDRGDLIGSAEGPAGIKPKAGGGTGNAGSRCLLRETSAGTKADIGQGIQSVGTREEIGQGDGLAGRSHKVRVGQLAACIRQRLPGSEIRHGALRTCGKVCRVHDLVGPVDAEGEFVDQVRPESVNRVPDNSDIGYAVSGEELAPSGSGRLQQRTDALSGVVILQAAHIDGGLLAQRRVHAQNSILKRVRVGEVVRKVVAARAGGIQAVGRGACLTSARNREEVQEGITLRADLAGRDDVASERDRAGRAGLVDGNQNARAGESLGEIARTFQCRGHGVVVRSVGPGVGHIVFGIEEEQFVAVLVEFAGDIQRAADGAAGIRPAIDRLRGRLAGNSVDRHSVLVVEPFVGVEHFVPFVVIHRAMELVRAVLDGHVHLSAVARAVFRRVVRNHELHFTDCIHAGRLITAGAGRAAILTDNTVERYQQLASRAVHRGIAAGAAARCAGTAATVTGRRHRAARQGAKNVKKVAARRRGVFDLRLVHRDRAVRTVGLNVGDCSRDFDRGGDVADRELDFVHVETLGLDDIDFLFISFEPRLGHVERVVAGGDLEFKTAARVGRELVDLLREVVC